MQLQYSTVALPHGIDTSLYYSIIYKCVGAEVLILRLITVSKLQPLNSGNSLAMVCVAYQVPVVDMQI